jgi:uncharacterized membrane protein/protein-disulfide isomerase
MERLNPSISVSRIKSWWLRRRSTLVYPGEIPKGAPHFVGKLPLLVLLLLGLIGLFATSFLTYRHIVLVSHTGNVGESFLCRAHGVVNCDGILVSEYAVLFNYFPSSVLGLMGFSFVVYVLLNALFNHRMRKVAWVSLVVYFFSAIGFSWYYMYIMIFEVDYLCTWCIVVHVVNALSLIIILIVSIRRRQEFLLPEVSTLGERIYFLGSGLLISALLFAGSMAAEKALSFDEAKIRYEELANDHVVIMAILRGSPTHDIPITKSDPVYGNPDAPLPIVLFSDFQCPVCPRIEEFLKRLVDLNPNVLSLVYKNYPLCTECNGFILGNLHPAACKAAQAAYSAFLIRGAPGFWAYSDLLFSNQKKLKRNPWMEFAEYVHIDHAKFKALMEPGSQAAMKVKEDAELGAKLRLSATPQVFFQGKNIPQNFKGEYFVDALEELAVQSHPEMKNLRLKRR